MFSSLNLSKIIVGLNSLQKTLGILISLIATIYSVFGFLKRVFRKKIKISMEIVYLSRGLPETNIDEMGGMSFTASDFTYAFIDFHITNVTNKNIKIKNLTIDNNKQKRSITPLQINSFSGKSNIESFSWSDKNEGAVLPFDLDGGGCLHISLASSAFLDFIGLSFLRNIKNDIVSINKRLNKLTICVISGEKKTKFRFKKIMGKKNIGILNEYYKELADTRKSK